MPAKTKTQFSSTIVATLETAWREIQKHNPDVPDAVIVVASGTEGKQPKLGHHAPLRWVDVAALKKKANAGKRKKNPKACKPGGVDADDVLAEILVAGEGLQLGPAEAMDTLLHEAVHAMAAARGIQDCSRGGRYHNARFREMATEIGLSATKQGTSGFADTKLTPTTEKKYAKTIKAIGKAITRVRAPNPKRGAKSSPSRMKLAECCCEEPRKIRLAQATFDVAPITCGECGEDFQLDGEG